MPPHNSLPYSLSGGGIYIRSGEDVPIDLLGVLISGNSANKFGGGVCVANNQEDDGSPELTLGNGTVITNNYTTLKASKGGGVYFGAGELVIPAAVHLQNGAEIYENFAAKGAGLYLVTGTSSEGNLRGYTVKITLQHRDL